MPGRFTPRAMLTCSSLPNQSARNWFRHCKKRPGRWLAQLASCSLAHLKAGLTTSQVEILLPLSTCFLMPTVLQRQPLRPFLKLSLMLSSGLNSSFLNKQSRNRS